MDGPNLIRGPFLSGTTHKLAKEIADPNEFRKVVILRLRNLTALDATGLYALEDFLRKGRRSFAATSR